MSTRIVGAVACALALASCASVPPDRAQARWTLSASSTVNTDALGRPAPLVVHLYALSACDAFNRATFFELYDRDRAVLGKAVLERRVLVLKPGERVRLVRPIDANTRAFAVVAAYQRIDAARWRAIVDISPSEPPRSVDLAASFGASGVALALTPERIDAHVASKLWRLVKPLWKKIAGSIGAIGAIGGNDAVQGAKPPHAEPIGSPDRSSE